MELRQPVAVREIARLQCDDPLELLLRAGINDWGGVSPLTIDFINPEAPWPELDELRRRTEAAGYELRDRLCVYPELIAERPELFAPEMLQRLRDCTDAQGWPRSSDAHTTS